MSLKIAAGLLLIGLVACIGAQAQAAERSVAPSRIVKFGDLDLTTAAGTRELKARIGRAAVEVCRKAVRIRQDVFFESCYASTREKGLAKVNWPTLAAVQKSE